MLVGFPKCGQVSMNHYLTQMFPGTPGRVEIGWRDDAVEQWEKIVANHVKTELIPVFVIRDPIERMWSAWTYMGTSSCPDFPTYLINRLYQPYGEGNPVMASNYWKYIRRFEKFRPIVVDMEEMAKNPNFSKLNVTKDVKFKNDVMPEFTPAYRKLAEDLFYLELKDNFWEGDYATGIPTKEALEILKPFSPGEIRRNTYRERA